MFSGTSTGSLTLTAATLPSPVVSGTITGTYTIGGTPTGSLISVLATGTSSARTLAARFAEITNVKDLGALGDGSTDDTAAFTAAIAIGGAIFIPAGTYIIDFTTVTTNCVFFGEGAGSIIKKKNNSAGTTYTDGTSYLFNIISYNLTIEFEHLTFDGNYAGQVTTRAGATPANTQTGVQVYNGAATVIAVGGAIKGSLVVATANTDKLMVRVANCLFINHISLAIYAAGTVAFPGSISEYHISNNTFRDFAGSVQNYHDGVSSYQGIVMPANGYAFSANGVQAHAVQGVDAVRMFLTNNTIIETRDPFAAPLSSGYEMNVYNMPACFYHGTVSAVAGVEQDDPLDWSTLIATGNYIQGCGRCEYTGNGLGSGFDVYTRHGATSITGNTFRNNYSSAIRGKTNARGLTITGNNIENVPNILIYSPPGINLHDATHPAQRGEFIISGNTIKGMADGIWVIGNIAPVEDSDANVADDLNDAQASTAVGATTDAAGYGLTSRTITLAAAGTGTLVQGDLITFAGDTTQYVITVGDTDVSGGGTISFHPGLVVAIPAVATAITVVTYAKSVNNIVISNNIITNITAVDMAAGVLRTAFCVHGEGIVVDSASHVVIANNVIDTVTRAVGVSSGAEHGIRARNTIKNLIITGNNIRRVDQSGINIVSHIGPALITNNAIDTCGALGITSSTNGDNIILCNTVLNTRTGGIVCGASGSLSATVANNVIRNVIGTSASTIRGIDSGAGTALQTFMCTGNRIDGVFNSGTGAAVGINVVLNATFSDVLTATVSHNSIEDVEDTGLFIQDYTGLISNNVFKSCNISGVTTQGAIFVNGVTNVGKTVIYGNTCDPTTNMWPTTGGGSWATVAARTIATGVLTVMLNTGTVLVATEAAAATDDLDTINGLQDGSITTFRAVNSARDVVFKDGTGNMKLNGDFTLNNVEDTITLRAVTTGAGTTTLYELSRSDNGA